MQRAKDVVQSRDSGYNPCRSESGLSNSGIGMWSPGLNPQHHIPALHPPGPAGRRQERQPLSEDHHGQGSVWAGLPQSSLLGLLFTSPTSSHLRVLRGRTRASHSAAAATRGLAVPLQSSVLRTAFQSHFWDQVAQFMLWQLRKIIWEGEESGTNGSLPLTPSELGRAQPCEDPLTITRDTPGAGPRKDREPSQDVGISPLPGQAQKPAPTLGEE